MNRDIVLQKLSELYPHSSIVCLPPENPTEIICETKPTKLHPEWSEAVAVIERSVPHFHKEMTEKYEVISGDLTVSIDGKLIHLKSGDSVIIEPYQVHFAFGNEAWIKVTAHPGWTSKDHILA